MKSYPLLFLLVIFFQMTKAQTHFETALQIAAEEDFLKNEKLHTVIASFAKAELIDSVDYNNINTLIHFVENPFDQSILYGNLQVYSIDNIKDAIESNQLRKQEVADSLYQFVIECNNTLPSDYNSFKEDDNIVFTQVDLDCFLAKTILREEEGLEEEASIVIAAGETITMSKDLDNNSVSRNFSLPTMIIGATSQFLVERVKQELLLAFFDRFMENIEKSPELYHLFPSTYRLLKNSDIFRVPSMGQLWVSAFKSDFENLHRNIENLILVEPKYAELRKKPAIQIFMLTNYGRDQLQAQADLSSTLDGLYQKFANDDNSVGRSIQLLQLIDYHVFRIGEADYSQLHNSTYTNTSLYFSALMYQQAPFVFDSTMVTHGREKVPFTNIIKNNSTDFTKAIRSIFDVFNLFEKRQDEYINSLTVIPYGEDSTSLTHSKSRNNETFLLCLESFTEVLDFAFTIKHFDNPNAIYTEKYYSIYKPLIKAGVNSIKAAMEKDLSNSLIQAMDILQVFSATRLEVLHWNLEDKRALYSFGKISRTALHDFEKKSKKEIKILNELVKNFTFYGSFFLDVLTANTANDIKYILDKYAAPVGSYRVKRQSNFSFSLSAYPGIYGGIENIQQSNSVSGVTGVTAPIGFALSWGNKPLGRNQAKQSFSLFLPVFDIGAAFSYRWNATSDLEEGFPEEIKFSQIFSPGAHVVWGLPKAPIAIMAGTQFTPKLRKILANSNELKSNALRFGVSITVDIPIFHFYKN